MTVGFRKSLFGFNSDDVMEYIEKSHKSFVEKETVLNEKVENLNAQLQNAKRQINEVILEKQSVEEELKKYTDQYDEIERLSQNIGKLYLVAENNANSVIESARQNKEIAEEQISKNMEYADDVYTALSSINDEITKTANEFTDRINALMQSLQKAKNDICAHNNSADEKIEEYKALLDNINA